MLKISDNFIKIALEKYPLFYWNDNNELMCALPGLKHQVLDHSILSTTKNGNASTTSFGIKEDATTYNLCLRNSNDIEIMGRFDFNFELDFNSDCVIDKCTFRAGSMRLDNQVYFEMLDLGIILEHYPGWDAQNAEALERVKAIERLWNIQNIIKHG